jgi:hypothetical protein
VASAGEFGGDPGDVLVCADDRTVGTPGRAGVRAD